MNSQKIVLTNDGNGKVTKKFAKQAKIFGTPEYKVWREFLNENPNAQMVVKAINKDKAKDTNRKNMTYENMRKYISVQENAENLSVEFDKIIVESKVQISPYKYVADWFVARFPKYKDGKEFQENTTAKEENKGSAVVNLATAM